jgi:hypothetical protein
MEFGRRVGQVKRIKMNLGGSCFARNVGLFCFAKSSQLRLDCERPRLLPSRLQASSVSGRT